MAGNLQPLDDKFAIVGPDGRPTLYFIKWAQQRQIDISDGITLTDLTDYLAAHTIHEGVGIQITPSGNLTDGPTIAADVQEILDQLSATRGTVIYRGLLGWTVLLPGTAGYVLSTNGAGADPTWVAQSGGGGGSTTLWDWGFAGAVSPLAVAGSTTATLGGGAVTTAMTKASIGNWYWFNAGQSGRSVTFDFGSAVVISGIIAFQDIVAAQGTWQPQFSDDNITYTNIGVAGAWGGAVSSVWNFTNSAAHRYWRLLQTAGTTSSASWQQGHMFRWGPA